MSIIRLKSSDGVIFDTEAKVAKSMGTVKQLLDECFKEDDENAIIPLVNVNSDILSKVLEYAHHHKDDPTPPEKNENEEYRTDDISTWDQNFLNVEQGTLLALVLAADYLNLKSLFDVTCKTVAIMIKGKSPEQIRTTFNIENDMPPNDQLDRLNHME